MKSALPAVGALLASTMLLMLVQSCAEPKAEAPINILLITVDTLRTDHVGSYGGPVPTPAMDRLAAEGVLVDGACTPTPSTGPAHASLMSGLYVWNHGILLNAVPMDDPELPNLAEILQNAGFDTGAFVSSFNVDQRWGFGRGFKTFHFEPTQELMEKAFWSRGEATTTRTLDWIGGRDDRPFFAWIHYFDPHRPYQPPADFARPASETVDLAHKSVPPKARSMEHLEAMIRAYRGEVAYTDAQIGRLLDGLAEAGRLDDTLIVLTSDHGEGLGDHQLLEHGWNLYDELVTVPLLLRGPGLPQGLRLTGDAQLEDLMPTILSLAGVDKPSALDGVDLAPWLSGQSTDSPRDGVLGRRAAFPDEPALFFERRGHSKWIGELDHGGQVFHLRRDPKELTPRDVSTLPDALRQSLVDLRAAPKDRVLDEESRKALEALGYL